MLLKLNSNLAGPDGAWAAGSVVELDRVTAKALIAGGYATAIGVAAKETATKPVNAETGKSEGAPEKAVAKPADKAVAKA